MSYLTEKILYTLRFKFHNSTMLFLLKCMNPAIFPFVLTVPWTKINLTSFSANHSLPHEESHL